jgi:hypothetical protein
LPSGPYDSSIRKFAECADRTLQKDKDYTVSEAARICGMDDRTVHGYVYPDPFELNKSMRPPKKVVIKKICTCVPGLMVDPPASLDGIWSVLTSIDRCPRNRNDGAIVRHKLKQRS